MNFPTNIDECGPYLHWTFEDPTKTDAQKNIIVQKTLDYLIGLKESINQADELGHTVLTWLVIVKNWSEKLKETISYLITTLGSDLKYQDSRGFSALHWAVLFNRVECVELLMNNGADPMLQDVDGKDSMHYARENEYHEVLDILSLKVK